MTDDVLAAFYVPIDVDLTIIIIFFITLAIPITDNNQSTKKYGV
jgi:hypothetical protein